MSAPGWAEMFRIFGRIGLLSFGGPAAQIAMMHREFVETRSWLSEKDFLGALSFCMLLPGPEAMQLATYTGWKLHGVRGGLIAGGLFVLPGAIIILALAYAYAYFGDLAPVRAAFLGIKAAVVVIVFQAMGKLARRALIGPQDWAVATLGFIAIFALQMPFPLILALAALWGGVQAPPATTLDPTPIALPRGTAARTLRTAVTWSLLWFAPLAIFLALDMDFLRDIALFFAKLAVVTFGGAYAVLAYMAQTVVADHAWLSAEQMIDALGLAETTPGPLILVTEFVALIAGFNLGGPGLALAAGVTALWMTFCPCFMWIFAGAPYVEWLLAQPRLRRALSMVTAAVVGVILNLALWFTVHVLFAEVAQTRFAPLPTLSSFDPRAAVLVVLAAVVMFGLRVSMVPTLAIMALAGLALGAFG